MCKILTLFFLTLNPLIGRKWGNSNYMRRGEPQKCFDIKNEIKQNPRPQQHALQLHFRFSDSHT